MSGDGSASRGVQELAVVVGQGQGPAPPPLDG